MIITQLLGGLGNQMFQYALARQLALIHNTYVEFDLTCLLSRDDKVDFTFRDFSLDVFDVNYKIYDTVNLSIIKKIYNDIFYSEVVEENGFDGKGFSYNHNVFKIKTPNIYLKGFWQNERYFKNAESIIRKDFSFKNPPSKENAELLRKIKSLNSVSIHFRRGDYISLTSANSFHGTCSETYYNSAMDIITKNIIAPHYFVFSDDITWVRNNISFDSEHTFVDINTGALSYEDMRLMSACKHNIIANSSFSWWGAWLNENPDKIVVAPEKWFNSTYTEIIPANWIRIL